MKSLVSGLFAVLLLATCDASTREAPTAPPARTTANDEQCRALSNKARDTVLETRASVPQCVVDADCKIVNFGVSCVDCLWIIGNDDVKAALTDRSTEIEQPCQTFHEIGCKVIPSGCPPIGVDQFRCEAGVCVNRPATTRN
ncbi:MAG TPA: hypothetical protein VGG33_13985 [Polyangia bacterium]